MLQAVQLELKIEIFLLPDPSMPKTIMSAFQIELNMFMKSGTFAKFS